MSAYATFRHFFKQRFGTFSSCCSVLSSLVFSAFQKQRFGTFARFRRPLAVRGSAPGKLLDLAACKILVNKLPAKRTVFIGSKDDMKDFVGLHFAWHGLESCCCSGVSHGLLHGILLGMNPAAVRAFRMGSSTAAWHGLESCCCSGVSHGLLHGTTARLRTVWLGHYFRLLHGIWRCGILVSDPASQRGCWPQEMFMRFAWRVLLVFGCFGTGPIRVFRNRTKALFFIVFYGFQR